MIGRASKRVRTSEPMEAILYPPIDKGKKVVENMSFAPDNELLNAAEVNVESTLASVTEMLYNKMFDGVLDASNPCFLALVSRLAYATKQ